MFSAPDIHQIPVVESANKGWIEVICGPMFSGKTEELIRRLKRALIAKQRIEIFKPVIDRRYHQENVVSHDERSIRSTPVSFSNDILLPAGNCQVIGIDEAQFFDVDIVTVCVTMANKGKRVIVAGLDLDYTAKPFGAIPQLLAVSEYVTKLQSICVICGNLASFTFRKTNDQQKIKVGATESYEPRCRHCFVNGMLKSEKS